MSEYNWLKRFGHGCGLTGTGEVLIAGGYQGYADSEILRSVHVYNLSRLVAYFVG